MSDTETDTKADTSEADYQGGDIPPIEAPRGDHPYALYLLGELRRALGAMSFEPSPGSRTGNLEGVLEHNLDTVEKVVRSHHVVELRRSYSRTRVSFVVTSSGECRSTVDD